MTKPSLYLAGPITNQPWESVVEWRNYVTKQCHPDIDCFSPLRGKIYLAGETSIKDQYNEHIMSTQRAILARDHYDATRRDLLFVNLLEAERVSIGTVMEIAWAHEARIPIVLCMKDTVNGKKNPHDHAMVREACPFIVSSVDDGILTARHILLSNHGD